MTSFFFDSSALIKRYIAEDGTAWVRKTVLPSAGHRIFMAKITPIEMVSAVARRHREGSITDRTARHTRILIDRHTRREYQVVMLSDEVMIRAEDLLENYTLRAYDAVQLASALEINVYLSALKLPVLVFVSADKRLNAVARAESLTVEDPNLH